MEASEISQGNLERESNTSIQQAAACEPRKGEGVKQVSIQHSAVGCDTLKIVLMSATALKGAVCNGREIWPECTHRKVIYSAFMIFSLSGETIDGIGETLPGLKDVRGMVNRHPERVCCAVGWTSHMRRNGVVEGRVAVDCQWVPFRECHIALFLAKCPRGSFAFRPETSPCTRVGG